MNVKGTLTPAACNISITGAADYGTLRFADLQAAGVNNGAYQLGEKNVTYNITCDSEVKIALTIKADSNATVNPSFSVNYNGSTGASNAPALGILKDFGVGKSPRYLGYYVVKIKPISFADSSAAKLLHSNNAGVTWTDAPVGVIADLKAATMYTWGKESGVPAAFSSLSGTLGVSAAVDPSVLKVARDDISFDTNATVTLYYI